MSFIRTTLIVELALVSAFTSMSASAGSVRSISPSYEVAGNSGETYKERLVTCSNTNEKRIIRLSLESNKWCAAPDFTECSSQKVKVANNACSAKSKSVVASKNDEQKRAQAKPQPKPAVSTKQKVDTSPKVDRIALETELIEIEQQRLALKKRQIELTRETLRLQAASQGQVNGVSSSSLP